MIFFLFFFRNWFQFFNHDTFLLSFCWVGFIKLIDWNLHKRARRFCFIVEVKKVFYNIFHLFSALLSIFFASNKKFVYWLRFSCFLLLMMLWLLDLFILIQLNQLIFGLANFVFEFEWFDQVMNLQVFLKLFCILSLALDVWECNVGIRLLDWKICQ